MRRLEIRYSQGTVVCGTGVAANARIASPPTKAKNPTTPVIEKRFRNRFMARSSQKMAGGASFALKQVSKLRAGGHRTRTVPASVPSLFHSSNPFVPSSAEK